MVFCDQRGAGLSERVADDLLTLDGHLQELRAVIDRVPPDRPPILIGPSWSAMLAAARLGQCSTNVQHGVLIGPEYLDSPDRCGWKKRGWGESSCDCDTSSFTDLIKDACAAVDMFASSPEIDGIVLSAHGAGTVIAPVVATLEPEVVGLTLPCP